MKTHVKKVALMAALAVTGSFIIQGAAAAASPITVEGIVYDKKNKPVTGVTVVAWCGGIHFFGGSGVTDANGHYVIHTNGDDCPFDNELTVTTDVDGDGLSDGATHTQAHTATFISIYLGKYGSVSVPEYGWVGASAAALSGMGIIGYVRRARLKNSSSTAN